MQSFDVRTPRRVAFVDITAQVAACDAIGSTKELTQPQAKAVADTLSRCKDRDQLIALLVEGETSG